MPDARRESAEALRILLDAFVPPDLRDTMEREGLVKTAEHAARHHAWHHVAEGGDAAEELRKRDLEIDRLRARVEELERPMNERLERLEQFALGRRIKAERDDTKKGDDGR